MNRLLVFSLLIILIIPLENAQKNADAICSPNQDWPAAPCYGAPGLHPTVERDKERWDGYYDFKGADWMEAKKQEMLDALRSGNLCAWENNSNPYDQNHNVLTYYFLNGIVSSFDCDTATEYRYSGQDPESENDINYYDFRNIPGQIIYSCWGPGLTSREACEFQNATMFGVIGIVITAVIGVPIVLFNRKRK